MPRTDAAMIAPAAFDEVITVSAMADFDGQDQGKARKRPCSAADDDDTFWDESNYGSAVDFAAPGVCIATTSQALWSGTSFAAPYVAGAAALYKIVHPSATPSQVKRALQAAAEYDWNVYATANASSGDDPDGRPEPLINVLNLKAIPKQQRTIQRNPISFPIDSVRYVSSITPRYPRSLLR
jgi:subtilisin family serine protease